MIRVGFNLMENRFRRLPRPQALGQENRSPATFAYVLKSRRAHRQILILAPSPGQIGPLSGVFEDRLSTMFNAGAISPCHRDIHFHPPIMAVIGSQTGWFSENREFRLEPQPGESRFHQTPQSDTAS